MVVLLPVALLIFGALIIISLQLIRPGFGYAWLSAVGTSLVVWIMILTFRWVDPGVFVLPSWTTLLSPSADLDFGMTNASWMYAFSLSSILLAVNITAPIRTRQQTAPWLWAGNMLVIAAGYMTTLAINPLAIILAWTSVDVVEIIVLIGAGGVGGINIRSVASFAARIIGTLVVIWAMVLSRSQGEVLTLGGLTPQMGLYLLLAVSLRLGVVPLQIHYSRIMPQRRGQNTILRLVVAASSLVILGRLPDLVMPVAWALFLSGFTALAALYGSAMWLNARDELSGRPYFIVALGGMAVASVVRAQSAASTAWGIALLLSGCLIFLYSIHDKRNLFAPMLGLIGLAGLPFMPSAGGWLGLIVYPFNILDIIFIISHIILLMGYLRHSLSPGEDSSGVEDWIQVVYPAGLMFLIGAQWIINVTSLRTALSPGVWWAGIVSLIIAMLCFILNIYFGKNLFGQNTRKGWLVSFLILLGRALSKFLSLEWGYKMIGIVYRLIQRLINNLTALLEGDGGVLWSLLLLVLFISIFRQGERP